MREDGKMTLGERGLLILIIGLLLIAAGVWAWAGWAQALIVLGSIVVAIGVIVLICATE